MSRDERWGTRDLAYSRQHRELHDDLSYIDIDGCEYCNRCKKPLALIETAQDIGQEWKATTIMQNLAKAASVPAFLVFYSKAKDESIRGIRWRQVVPWSTAETRCTWEEWAEKLRTLRDVCHPLTGLNARFVIRAR